MRQFLLIYILAISSLVTAQDSTKTLRLGLDANWGINNAGIGNYFPGITLSWPKHCIFAGPQLVNNADIAQRGPLIGLQAGYQIYPNGKTKRFNLFFEYDLNYVDAKMIDEGTAPSAAPNGGVKRRIIGVYSLFNYLSYGFRLNITDGFYFKTNAGIGLGWTREEYIYEYWNGTSYGDYHLPPYFGSGGLVKIGLGYEMINLKRR